jgi:hypothetical protein
VHTLTSENGVSLELSDRFSEYAAAEGGPVCLVAWVDPWPWEDAFRPNLTVEVESLVPETATIQQLSSRTIATQLALGRHVVACDVTSGASDGGARRIAALYPALETTVVQLQHVAIIGGKAVIVSMQHGVGHHREAQRAFDHAVETLACTFDDPPVAPDPGAVPRMDDFAQQRGLDLEDLSKVGSAQRFSSAGPTLDGDQLESLKRGKLGRRVDPGALESGGLVTDERQLTEVGEAAHRALGSPQRRVTVTVRSDDDPDPAMFEAYQRGRSTAVLATPPPGVTGSSRTLEVIASQTTAITLARWLGLGPAWSFAISDDGLTRRIDGGTFDARLRDRAAPPPPDANAALARMWGEPWQVATLSATIPRLAPASVVTAAGAGSYLLQRDPGTGEVQLTSMPGLRYLLLVLAISGFDLSE